MASTSNDGRCNVAHRCDGPLAQTSVLGKAPNHVGRKAFGVVLGLSGKLGSVLGKSF